LTSRRCERAAKAFAAAGNAFGEASALSLSVDVRAAAMAGGAGGAWTVAPADDGATDSFDASSEDDASRARGAGLGERAESPALLAAACRAWLRAVDELSAARTGGWSAFFGVRDAMNARHCLVPHTSARLLPKALFEHAVRVDESTLLVERQPLADAVAAHAGRQLWRTVARLRGAIDVGPQLAQWRQQYAVPAARRCDAASWRRRRRALRACATRSASWCA
jgi:hypothetical protein